LEPSSLIEIVVDVGMASVVVVEVALVVLTIEKYVKVWGSVKKA